IAIAINIRNAKSLERFVTSMNKDLEVRSSENEKFRFMIKNKSLLAWSKKLLVLVDARPAPTESHLISIFDNISRVKDSTSLFLTNDSFRKSLTRVYDASMWVDMEKLGMSKLLTPFAENVDLKDNYLQIHANFDEGLVTTKTNYFASDFLFQKYAPLLDQPIDSALLSNLPLEDPAIMVAASMAPHGIDQLLMDINLKEKVENLLSIVSLNIDQFTEMISGDVVLVLKDVENLNEVMEDADSANNKQLVSDFVLGFGVNNKVVYDSLQSLLMNSGLVVQEEGYKVFFNEVFILEMDSLIYITKNETIKNDFLAGTYLKNPAILSMAENNWLAVYADESISQRTIKGETLFKEIAGNLLRNENLQMESLKFTYGTISNKNEGTSELILKNKDVNSLLAMLEVLKEIVLQSKWRLDPNYYVPE
ncbi:MAG: hypothetical protein AAFU64_07660, partial [Bacteroidota bacterium]